MSDYAYQCVDAWDAKHRDEDEEYSRRLMEIAKREPDEVLPFDPATTPCGRGHVGAWRSYASGGRLCEACRIERREQVKREEAERRARRAHGR